MPPPSTAAAVVVVVVAACLLDEGFRVGEWDKLRLVDRVGVDVNDAAL